MARGLLAAAAVALGLLVRASGDGRVGALLAAAVACGHVYQAPPFRLSYKVSGPLKLCLFLSPIGQ